MCDEDEDIQPALVGSFSGSMGKCKTAQIGFIRKKKDYVSQGSDKNASKGKRPSQGRAKAKGTTRKRANR